MQFNMYTKDLEVLQHKLRSGIISTSDFNYEREKLLVENSIRDFANLGFWEVDGRVK